MKIPGQKSKVWGKETSWFHGEGGSGREVGFRLLLDTTGSRKYEADAVFLP